MRNDVFEALLYGSGVTSHGCWSKLDYWDKQAIERFGQMIVEECAQVIENARNVYTLEESATRIRKHFGIK
jgi:hypothetical protein